MNPASSADPTTFDWLREQVRELAAEFATAIDGLDAATPVPGLDWNVGQLGAHIASLPGYYLSMVEGEPLNIVEHLDAVDELINGLLVNVGTTDPTELAKLIPANFDRFLNALGTDGERLANWYVTQYPVVCMAGAALGELLLHRADLAGACGHPGPQITAERARAVLRGTIPVSGHIARRDVAVKATGIYHLGLRGSDDHWTLDVGDHGVVVTAGKPPRADLHQVADPVALLKVGYGRMHPVRAALTGKIVAWGTKPWLALHFRNLFHTL